MVILKAAGIAVVSATCAAISSLAAGVAADPLPPRGAPAAVGRLAAADVGRADPTAGVSEPFSLVIKPISGPDGVVGSVEVSERFVANTTDGMPLSLQAALSAVTVRHIADSIAGLTIADASGEIAAVTTDDEAASGNFAYRHWRLIRRSRGPLTIRYRIPVQSGALRGGPPFAIVPAGGGFAGSGYAFLLLPENLAVARTRVSWDLSSLPAHSVGVLTAGEGEFELDGSPQQLASQWVLAGPAATDAKPGDRGFHAYVLGTPRVAASDLAAFGEGTYRTLTGHLDWSRHPDYRLMVRALDGASFTTGTAGLGQAAGALVTTGTDYYEGQGHDTILVTIFHEMTHFWVGELADGGNWFSEGLTVYLSAKLSCEAGLLRPSACAGELNHYLREYATSPGHSWPQSRIEGSGFSSENVRTVPYARGALFFAELNARIEGRHHGRRSLLDALRPLMVDRAHGVPMTLARFEAMLRREVGSDAVADFRAKILDGTRAITPPAGAFGRCLVLRPVDAATLSTDAGGTGPRSTAGPTNRHEVSELVFARHGCRRDLDRRRPA